MAASSCRVMSASCPLTALDPQRSAKAMTGAAVPLIMHPGRIPAACNSCATASCLSRLTTSRSAIPDAIGAWFPANTANAATAATAQAARNRPARAPRANTPSATATDSSAYTGCRNRGAA